MRTGFILLLIGFFFLLSLQSRIAALHTYWWFGVFRPHDWIWGDVSSLHLPLIASLLLIVPSLINKEKVTIAHPIPILMLTLLSLLVLANYLVGCANPIFIRTSTPLNIAILIYVVLLTAGMMKTKERFFWLLLVIVLSLGFHTSKGGFNSLLTGASLYGANTLSGFLSGSNAYALSTGMMVFFNIFCIQYSSIKISEIKNQQLNDSTKGDTNKESVLKYKLIFYIGIFILLGSLYNIVAIESRGSFLATSAALGLWVYFHPKRVKIFFTTVILAVLIFSVVPLPEGYEDRIASAFADEEELDSSAASRPHFWSVARLIASDYPLGVGPGCYPKYYNFYDTSNGQYGMYRSVHSSHFQILADGGYLGAFVWFLLLLISYKKLWSIRRVNIKQLKKGDKDSQIYIYLSNSLICSMTVFILGGSFYELAYNDFIWLILALTMQLDLLTKKKLDKKKKKEVLLNS